jgi:hypothetical protein
MTYVNKGGRKMPGRNGTGPEGKGPMTGRKMGNCSNGSNNSLESNERTFGFARGLKMQGAGRGCGRRQGRRGL